MFRALLAAVLLGLWLPGSAAALSCPPLPEGVRSALAVPATPVSPLPEVPVLPIAAGGIAPHHDLAGPLILRFYEALAAGDPHPRRVILLSPDHFRQGRASVSFCGADWETSFGSLRADREGVDVLAQSGLASRQDDLFPREHGVTVHLPLIRRAFPEATVLPLTVRAGASDLQLLGLRRLLLPLLVEGGLLVLSMDLSHHKRPPEALREDERTLPVLLAMRVGRVRGLDLDCPRGAVLFLGLLADRGIREGVLLEHAHSGTFTGDETAPCTTYATVLYPRSETGGSSGILPKPMLTKPQGAL
ncbi:protein of unknown function DUF52 [Aminomonas paucivorans DSM 12260]|uniref:AmmeMemoRadiSam system protein B n=1 Tax=Aminomonas paucivorans DSM 12260 TaxID=584708 RepID=E3CY68_9BACT|nr:AmmeMemoRadiSam system protein B [Aminomonas paucivorans]EFQ23601.1 protein of unknown function DUF52 [Aminomonas paucivorans DSM 12260]